MNQATNDGRGDVSQGLDPQGDVRRQSDDRSSREFAEAGQVQPSPQDAKPQGRTHTADDGGGTAPRLPHEHDESSDSQDNGGKPRPIIEKAHDDVVAGRVDTDRSGPMNETYREQKDVDRTGVEKQETKKETKTRK